MDVLSEADITGPIARDLRVKAGLNQAEFWGAIGVNQSSGSRYEQSKNRLQRPVRLLLLAVHIAGLQLARSAADLTKLAEVQQTMRTVDATVATIQP